RHQRGISDSHALAGPAGERFVLRPGLAHRRAALSAISRGSASDRAAAAGGRRIAMSTSGQQIGSSALEVLSYAQSVGVSLSERDGSLIYRGPDEAITQPLLAALRTHKDTILGLLRASVEDAEDQ